MKMSLQASNTGHHEINSYVYDCKLLAILKKIL